ncbi:MAG: hypothetical protein RLZZ292_3495, partial [Bacteroidota bacterium]
RLALIIANADYNGLSISQLPYAVQDGKIIDSILIYCKFDIFKKKVIENANRMEMWQILSEFAQAMEKYDTGLIFYAGHGINIKGDNYFIPIDYQIGNHYSFEVNKQNAKGNCIGLPWIKDQLLSTKNKNYIIIGDAVRNNPFRFLNPKEEAETWTSSTFSSSGVNMLVCFAASEMPKSGENSNFVQSLLKYITIPGISIDQLFWEVESKMKEKVGQQYKEINQIKNGFFFIFSSDDQDKDNDGIKDSEDRCPYHNGLRALKGCPDFDGDNIPDMEDYCKKQKGDKDNNGCPTDTSLIWEFIDDINFEFIFVEGGSFKMGYEDKKQNREGANNNNSFSIRKLLEKISRFNFACCCITGSEENVHKVELSPYYIGKYEITQNQWRNIMKQDLSNVEDCGNCPVDSVSWDDAQDFIQKFNQKTGENYRLPTEAEWEYAARGGNKSQNFLYSGSNLIDSVAWYTSDMVKPGISSVGQKTPNELGIFDMSGNVEEWCNDWYRSPYKKRKQRNPTGPKEGTHRICRGGYWRQQDLGCRVSYRAGHEPSKKFNTTGFRICRSK